MSEVNPSHLKLEYLNKYATGKVFFETGTYMGDTVKLAQEYGFDFIYSVELNKELATRAEKMFENDPRVVIINKDSVDALRDILPTHEHEDITFWLDAHASGPLPGGVYGASPLISELEAIGDKRTSLDTASGQMKEIWKRRNHTIFIDDRRLFGSGEWNFLKEQEVINLLVRINPNYKLTLLDGHVPQDVICAHVKGDDTNGV